MPPFPSGTVAFLFADIERSTERWERDRAAMGAAVERYLALARRAVEDQRGVLFKVIGDGVQAAFPTVPDAVAAALDLQRALAAEPWPPAVGDISARVAIHVGSAAPRDGDYLAPCLNRLARLLAAGSGGQVLLTEAAADMAREALPPGSRLRDLGPHRLRDLLVAEHVAQLDHPDLRRDFPPLRSLERSPHNLPVQPTAFIGRDDDLARLAPLLRGREARLVTLTGPPGVGKTRLALQVAADVLDAFPDGAFVVALAPLADPGMVAPAIAQALGIHDAGDAPVTERLVAFLRERDLLLVLDNFEHLLDAAPLASDLLAAAPRLVLLATSRSPLRLRGEREVAIRPFVVPPRRAPAAAADLLATDAVRLFVARARDVRADLRIDDETTAAIAEICRQLDGLPLAIELAAVRSKLLGPSALLHRLRQRLPLLTGGPRDAPPRQRTLGNTIAWSYDLLPAEEQRLFRRLAVFVGGWTIESAEAVANAAGDLGLDLLDGLAALIDDSLILDQRASPAAGDRFTMLLTIREFALDQLDRSGDLAGAQQALRDYLLGLAERAAGGLGGADQLAWLDRLEAEHDNLRAALGDALQRDDGDLALGLAVRLWRFWLMRGHTGEGRGWLERALAVGAAASADLRAGARQGLGHLAIDLGNYGEAHAQFDASLALCREANDRAGIAESLSGLGVVALNRQQYAAARVALDEALAIRRDLGEAYGVASSLYLLGIVERETANHPEAGKLFEEALAMWRRLDNPGRIGQTLVGLGMVRRFEGDAAAARALIEEARGILDRLGYRYWVAVTSMQLGHVARLEGDDRQAIAHYLDSLARDEELGANEMAVENIEFLACAVTGIGEPVRAATLFGAAAALRAHFDLPPPMDTEAAALATHRADAERAAGPGWAGAWAAGQAMTPEQAFAEARSLSAFAADRPLVAAAAESR